MRRFISLFIAAIVTLGAATKVNLLDIKPLSNGPAVPYLVLYHPTKGWMAVTPDPSIVIDTSGVIAIIKTAGIAPGLPISMEDDFTMASAAVFTTSAPPVTLVDVYRNGTLQRNVADYTTSGGSGSPLTINLSNASQGDYVTLRYQR